MRKGRRRERGPDKGKGMRRGWLRFALFFLCFVLLTFSRLETDIVRQTRSVFADLAAPVLEVASLPVIHGRHAAERVSRHLDRAGELERLERENRRLRQWEWRARRLERRLEHLRGLLNVVEEPALDFVTGQVIADARGPFARSILVNVGRENGVKSGYAVIDGGGLVGRVVHSGDNAARVILLNDFNSRIPVLVGPSAVRAVLVGDNTAEPRLRFLPRDARVFEGDAVFTSGHGGLFPRGLRIGAIEADGGEGYRVSPHARMSELDYVSVLFFDSPVVIARETEPGETENAAAAGDGVSKHAKARAPARLRVR